MSKKHDDVLLSRFFGNVILFIQDAMMETKIKKITNIDYSLVAPVIQENYLEILQKAKSIGELPENLQKISKQTIPYFLKNFKIYKESDIPL